MGPFTQHQLSALSHTLGLLVTHVHLSKLRKQKAAFLNDKTFNTTKPRLNEPQCPNPFFRLVFYSDLNK